MKQFELSIHRLSLPPALLALALPFASSAQLPPADSGYEPMAFVNYESPHVHPVDLTPSGAILLVVNTSAATLMVFDATGSAPVLLDTIPVGFDPVSVRARTETEAWVVNHVSDTLSIIDLVQGIVTQTVQTADEPADVIFAGSPERAFVSASAPNLLQVFDSNDPGAVPIDLIIRGEDPRALATDGSSVYAAVFESGNSTTLLAGGFHSATRCSMRDTASSRSQSYAPM